jgi:hypothetical protein
MPKHTGIYRKGNKYYGAKWYNGKTYVTSLYPTADETTQAREELIKNLKKGITPDRKGITVKDFIKFSSKIIYTPVPFIKYKKILLPIRKAQYGMSSYRSLEI